MHAFILKKPSNMKHGLYHPLLVPTRPLKQISMEFVGGLATASEGYCYLFMVIDKFNNMFFRMPYRKIINA